jgi:hypothetical protein
MPGRHGAAMALTTVPRSLPAVRGRAAATSTRIREAALRHRLGQDPNDAHAFRKLVTLLTRVQAAQKTSDGVPGNGNGTGNGNGAGDDVAWALAAELARRPRAWYPLVELARLSLDQDLPSAVRRLATASERDLTGRGLTCAIVLLRQAGRPDEGFRLGLAHWRPHHHSLAAGRQLVLAGLAARPGGGDVRQLVAEVARRTQRTAGGTPPPIGGTAGHWRTKLLDRLARVTGGVLVPRRKTDHALTQTRGH